MEFIDREKMRVFLEKKEKEKIVSLRLVFQIGFICWLIYFDIGRARGLTAIQIDHNPIGL